MKEEMIRTNNETDIGLQRYFNHIGYTGDGHPTLDTLIEIHYRHVLTIPFENLNPLLGIPVHLDLASISQKFIIDHRGGYCFEQNLLLSHVLQAVGFKVKKLAARVLWGEKEEAQTMRTHMLLLVEVEGEYFIADVGFGGMTLTSPVKLIPNIMQQTPHEPFRLLNEGQMYVLQVNIRNEWKSVYSFGLDAYHMPDYEVFNYYLSTHASSHFVKDLIAARPTPNTRCTLKNNIFTIHGPDGTSEKRILNSINELRQVLTDVFGIHLPQHPNLSEKLQQELLKTTVLV